MDAANVCGGCLIHYVLWRDAVGGIPTGATTIPLNSISANKVNFRSGIFKSQSKSAPEIKIEFSYGPGQSYIIWPKNDAKWPLNPLL